MRRRSATTSSASFSLFPFLAVLLCVMGALIVVLVVIARQARARATEAAKARSATMAASSGERAEQLAALQWRSEQLRQSRDKTAQQLEQQRLELSHIEEHARALRAQLAELEKAAAVAESAGDDQKRAGLRSELAALTARVATAEEELEKARRAASDQSSPSYAIVPFEGPNHTHRRPLYIECRADGIVLQPEGIVLTEQDFWGPLGPGNPLAAALRAAREYLVRNQRTNLREAGEPYPLLLVRPDGIGAYYAAREAMTSWGADFGYELIDQDWKLDFNPPNAELAEATRAAVEEARLRQQQLALAAPRRYTDGERPLFRASPTRGGVVREGRVRGDSAEIGERYGQGRRGGFGERYSRDRDGSARAGGSSSNGASRASGSSSDDATLSGPYDSLLAGSGDKRAGSAGEHTEIGKDRASTAANGGPSRGGGQDEPPMVPLGSDPTDAGDSREASQGGTTRTQSAGQTARSGGERSASSASASGSPQVSASLDPTSAGGTPGLDFTVSPTAKSSLAARRGKNWGLPDAAFSAVPITRPLRIQCGPDRLVVRPDDHRARGGKTVALGPKTEDSMEELVSIVWEHIDSWGSAGRGMYWRPILSIEVLPGGDGRFADLKTLLADSGLDVRARGAGASAAQAPATTRER